MNCLTFKRIGFNMYSWLREKAVNTSKQRRLKIMKAYLNNSIVSLENSTGAIPVELESFIAFSIASAYDRLEDQGCDCDDGESEPRNAGDLRFQYYENGEVAILRWTGNVEEKIANGQIANLLYSNWAAVQRFSVANPTASYKEFLVFAL